MVSHKRLFCWAPACHRLTVCTSGEDIARDLNHQNTPYVQSTKYIGVNIEVDIFLFWLGVYLPQRRERQTRT